MVEYLIIGYWSKKAGRGYATYNMIASGMSVASKCKRNVVLIQGKNDYNRIEYAFSSYEEKGFVKEDYGYYNIGGVENVVRKLENGIFSIREYESEIVRVKDTNLYYIPVGECKGNDMLYKNFKESFCKLADFARSVEDIFFVELYNGTTGISREILENLDLLVINESQDSKDFGSFEYGIEDKIVYLVGGYDMNSCISLDDIRRKYRIKKGRIGVIPYDIRYKDAMFNGKCMEFFERHRNISREDMEYSFMRYLDMVSDMIIKRCDIE